MAVHIKKEFITETLSTEAAQGKRHLEPFKTFAKEHSLPVNILEDKEVVNEGEIHDYEGDLWQCLEGEVTFVCGGVLESKKAHPTKKGEWSGTGIGGGKEITLAPGDWLWIPAGEAHLHKTDETARLVIIKIPSSSS